MEDEDTYGDSGHADDLDELDEEENAEEVPNPASWNQDISSIMTVNDGHDSAWQYHQNNIAIGAITTKKRHIRDILGRTNFFCHAYDTSMTIIVTKPGMIIDVVGS